MDPESKSSLRISRRDFLMLAAVGTVTLATVACQKLGIPVESTPVATDEPPSHETTPIPVSKELMPELRHKAETLMMATKEGERDLWKELEEIYEMSVNKLDLTDFGPPVLQTLAKDIMAAKLISEVSDTDIETIATQDVQNQIEDAYARWTGEHHVALLENEEIKTNSPVYATDEFGRPIKHDEIQEVSILADATMDYWHEILVAGIQEENYKILISYHSFGLTPLSSFSTPVAFRGAYNPNMGILEVKGNVETADTDYLSSRDSFDNYTEQIQKTMNHENAHVMTPFTAPRDPHNLDLQSKRPTASDVAIPASIIKFHLAYHKLVTSDAFKSEMKPILDQKLDYSENVGLQEFSNQVQLEKEIFNETTRAAISNAKLDDVFSELYGGEILGDERKDQLRRQLYNTIKQQAETFRGTQLEALHNAHTWSYFLKLYEYYGHMAGEFWDNNQLYRDNALVREVFEAGISLIDPGMTVEKYDEVLKSLNETYFVPLTPTP